MKCPFHQPKKNNEPFRLLMKSSAASAAEKVAEPGGQATKKSPEP
jgi:hypothetical protein